MSGEFLLLGDGYSYDVNPSCVLIGHNGGSASLDDVGANDFVKIDGTLVVTINSTHSSSCPMGCKMTITGPNSFVSINGTPVAINKSQGDMGGCHPTVTVPTNYANTWVSLS